MISFWLRGVLVFLVVAAALALSLAPHPAIAALSVLVVFLAILTGIVVATFVVSRRHASKTPPQWSPDLLTAASVFLREWLAHLALFVFILPFERAWLGDDTPARHASDSVPVLLIHGYMCNRGAWWWIRRKLAERGFTVATVNLEPPCGGIDGFVDQVHARIEALCAQTSTAQVVLITHSMGGLIARAYLRKHGPRRVARLITLACPHHGTWIAYYGLGENTGQMQPGSAWIRNLERADPGVPFLSVWSPADNYVVPQDSTRHAQAREKIVPAAGHVAQLFSPTVLEILLSELAHRSDRQR